MFSLFRCNLKACSLFLNQWVALTLILLYIPTFYIITLYLISICLQVIYVFQFPINLFFLLLIYIWTIQIEFIVLLSCSWHISQNALANWKSDYQGHSYDIMDKNGSFEVYSIDGKWYEECYLIECRGCTLFDHC